MNLFYSRQAYYSLRNNEKRGISEGLKKMGSVSVWTIEFHVHPGYLAQIIFSGVSMPGMQTAVLILIQFFFGSPVRAVSGFHHS